MTGLREKLEDFYAKYGSFIMPVLKFAISMLVFVGINNFLGYLAFLNNLVVVIILAALCAILPWNGMVIIGMVMIILHCFGLSLPVGMFAVILYLIMVLFYFRFVSTDAAAILLTPFAFKFHIPGMVPVTLGIVRSPASAVSAALGIISWEFLKIVNDSASAIASAESSSALDVLKGILDQMINDQEMFLLVIASAAVILVMCLIRTVCSVYSWQIAVIAGSLVYLVICFLGATFLGVETDILWLVVGIAIPAGIWILLSFIFYDVDFASAERLQFEDDEYYYYVKAVPKRLSPEKVRQLERAAEQADKNRAAEESQRSREQDGNADMTSNSSRRQANSDYRPAGRRPQERRGMDVRSTASGSGGSGVRLSQTQILNRDEILRRADQNAQSNRNAGADLNARINPKEQGTPKENQNENIDLELKLEDTLNHLS